MSCPNKERNLDICNCSYPGCSRKGLCCDCILYHKNKGHLPACYFPNDIEKNYDRSIENFIKVYQKHKHL